MMMDMITTVSHVAIITIRETITQIQSSVVWMDVLYHTMQMEHARTTTR